MQGLLLDRVASVWRKSLVGSVYDDTQVYGAVRCAIVPISQLDRTTPYAYESTHLLWVDYWLVLRKEDQIREGRRTTPEGDILQYIYTINGRREFRLGIPQIAYYVRLQD